MDDLDTEHDLTLSQILTFTTQLGSLDNMVIPHTSVGSFKTFRRECRLLGKPLAKSVSSRTSLKDE